ncbi:hypothetical protein POM88_019505 [Heracleum sosnowskyi]|uniref:NB-ARC domain-containing protein n=1 Tax=Heracleum sosnowskyi TaxID=360622 RepID=A0AAD8IAC1_9APIA|nr:hypothetical protein POM88_019505 [Heracleum sosnowskyi]
MLTSFSKNFESFSIIFEDNGYDLVDKIALSVLVSDILSSKRMQVSRLRNFKNTRVTFLLDSKWSSMICSNNLHLTKKHLEVISLVGMAGLGETTLARRLYNDHYVVSYFYVRAWVTCSQIYQNRDLLLAILSSLVEITDEVCDMNESVLAHDLYRALKGQSKESSSRAHSITKPSTISQSFVSTNILCIPSKCNGPYSKASRSIFVDVWDTSKLIRALDISSIELLAFSCELFQLVHLRYLELRFRSGNPPESISLLRELQTLIMSSRMNMVIPKNIWQIINLKHLCIKSGENLVNLSTIEEEPSLFVNLHTMSLVSPTRPCQDILARTPNLQKLGLCGPLMTKSRDMKCPDLGPLLHLKTLKLLNTISLCKAGRLSTSVMFPESLKSLTVA